MMKEKNASQRRLFKKRTLEGFVSGKGEFAVLMEAESSQTLPDPMSGDTYQA